MSQVCLSLEPTDGEKSSYASAIRAARSDAPVAVMVALMEGAAHEGDARALYALATWYLHGSYEYKQAPQRAIPLLHRAADGGVREAMFDLGVSYDAGVGVHEDRRRAYLWYLRAALRGDREAIGLIANYTAHGRGVTKDHQVALVWYELAEALGVDREDAAAYRDWLEDQEE